MKRSSDNRFEYVLIALFILLVVYMGVKRANAQDSVDTWFSSTCIETLSPVHYRLHFGYASNGIETFKVSTIANVSIGDTVTTEAGTHELGYIDAYSHDSPYDFAVDFTGNKNTQTLHLNTWTITTPCEVASVLPDATPEPTPDVEVDGCPAWAVDSASGQSVCLWSLPRAGGYQ